MYMLHIFSTFPSLSSQSQDSPATPQAWVRRKRRRSYQLPGEGDGSVSPAHSLSGGAEGREGQAAMLEGVLCVLERSEELLVATKREMEASEVRVRVCVCVCVWFNPSSSP